MHRPFAVLALIAAVACRDGTQPVTPLLPTAQVEGGPGSYELVPLGHLPIPAGNASEATDINNQGQIVGWSGPGLPGPSRVTHAFLWEDGVLSDLGTLGGENSRADRINDAGQIAGASSTPAGGVDAFLWEAGTMRDLGSLGGNFIRVTGLTSGGAVTGWGSTASGATHAFLWRDGQMQDLGTLGGDHSFAFAVSNRGQVVGQSEIATGDLHAFLWDAGLLHDLGTLGGSSSSASAISEAGAVTGTSTDSAGVEHAFLWEDGVMRSLGELPGFTSGAGAALANSGAVAGWITRANDQRGVIWTRDGIQDVGFLFPLRPHTTLLRMNERGQVAGTSRTSGFSASQRTVLWEDGVLRDLGSLSPGRGSFPNALNQKGDLVGWTSSDGSRDTFQAVLWRRRPGAPMH